MNLSTNPGCDPRDVFFTAFASADTSVLEEGLSFAGAVSDAVGCVPCSCACDTLTFPTPNSNVVPRIAIRRFLFIYPHGMATAATNAADDAICATDSTFFNLLLPRTGLSGTTIVSPGPMVAESTLPDQKPPCFPPVTEPSERIMKIPPLFASSVGPPAWERYQLAFLPGVKVRALELKTCPMTNTAPGCLGTVRESPARSSMSSGELAKPLRSGRRWITSRPDTGALRSASNTRWRCWVAACCNAASSVPVVDAEVFTVVDSCSS